MTSTPSLRLRLRAVVAVAVTAAVAGSALAAAGAGAHPGGIVRPTLEVAHSGLQGGTESHPERVGGKKPSVAELYAAAGLGSATAAAAEQVTQVGPNSRPPGDPIVAELATHVLPSCTDGDGPADEYRVQLLYVREQSTASRLSALTPVFRHEAGVVDDIFAVSSLEAGQGRRVRWVHDASCLPVIPEVVVADGTIAQGTTGFWNVRDAIAAQGWVRADRKYALLVDSTNQCGLGELRPDDAPTGNINDGTISMTSVTGLNCLTSWDGGVSTLAHELVHTLGAVQSTAPNASAAGHCTDLYELMCYDDDGAGPVQTREVCGIEHQPLLDCNADDYFWAGSTAGTPLEGRWNVASSRFLDAVPALVSPEVTVTAGATEVDSGSPVTFTATSASAVTGWTWELPDSCTAPSLTEPSVTMTCPYYRAGPQTVTASAAGMDGLPGTASRTVTVVATAAPTVAINEPTGAYPGTSFTVTAAGTGSGPLTYTWWGQDPDLAVGGCDVTGNPGTATATVTCAPGATHVYVYVEAMQADGRFANTYRYVQLQEPGTGPDPDPEPADPTGWAVSATNTGTPAVTGTLARVDGSGPVDGAPVSLQVRWAGTSTWVTHTTGLVTDATGRAAAPLAGLNRVGEFRFRFAGTDTLAASTSDAVTVKVPTALSMTVGRGTPRPFTARLAKAGTAFAGQTVVLQSRPVGSTRWVNVASGVTTRAGVNVEKVRVRRTAYYRFVYAGTGSYRPATSKAVKVRR